MEPHSAWQPHVRQGHTHMQSNVQGCLKATAKPTATVTCRNYWYQCYIPLCFSGDIMIRYPLVLQLSAGASNIVLIIHTTEPRYRKVRWFPQIHTADVAHAFLFKPLLIWLECEGFSVGLRNLCIFTRTRRLLCRGFLLYAAQVCSSTGLGFNALNTSSGQHPKAGGQCFLSPCSPQLWRPLT